MLLLCQAESYYDLPSWTDDEDELAEEQQQPAGSTDGSLAAEAVNGADAEEVHNMDAADSTAAAGELQAPQLDVEAAPIQQHDAAGSCLPNGVQGGLQENDNSSQQQPGQQQVQVLGGGNASEAGSVCSSDTALAGRQQQQQQQHDTAQLREHVAQQQQQQQQGVAEKLQAGAAAAGSSEALSGSEVVDAAATTATDAAGQPTPVRPVKRFKADPEAAS
jgi:hypothetical protein